MSFYFMIKIMYLSLKYKNHNCCVEKEIYVNKVLKNNYSCIKSSYC